MSKELSAKIKK